MIFKKMLDNMATQKQEQRRAALYRDLIRHEAKVGGTLFGPVAKGGRREFFCLDRNTWVWHEEWIDENGQTQVKTTRYDIRPTGILKAQDGQEYRPVSLQEARHIRDAAHLYVKKVKAEVYQRA
jgi:hypothetical protein